MKRFSAILVFVAMATSSAATAQNAGEIARARSASCPGCNLFQADFTGVQSSGRSFANARLRQSDLSSSVMNRANFSGADLRDVEAYGGVFGGASCARADLTNASFVGAYLEGASFAGARLSGTNFSGAEMHSARGLTQAQLNAACGDESTRLPPGLRIRTC